MKSFIAVGPIAVLCNLVLTAHLHAQSVVFTNRNGANTAYCGLSPGGPGELHRFSLLEPTHDVISVSDPGATNRPQSSAASRLDVTASNSGITLSAVGSAQRGALRPFIDFGVAATADARDSWAFTLAAPARFTLNATLSGSSTEASSPIQGYAFGGINLGQVILDPGTSPDALGGGLTGSGTRVRHASGRLLAGRYSIQLNCRVEGTNFPFSGSFNSFVALELAPDAPLITQFRTRPQGLEIEWTDLSPKRYTVETTDSLSGGNWMPASGATWPISGHTIVLPRPTALATFYRVRME